jgi:hypothetical protein
MTAVVASLVLFCSPLTPPAQQGDERFYRVELSPAAVRFEVADLTSPFTDFNEGHALLSSYYSDNDSFASASWEGGAALSLAYFGGWWGGSLRTPGPSGASEELDLRCEERGTGARIPL